MKQGGYAQSCSVCRKRVLWKRVRIWHKVYRVCTDAHCLAKMDALCVRSGVNGSRKVVA